MISTILKYFLYDIALCQLFENINKNFPAPRITIVDPSTLNVGDYVTFNIEGNIRQYLITGYVTHIYENGTIIMYSTFNNDKLTMMVRDDMLIGIMGSGAYPLKEYIGV